MVQIHFYPSEVPDQLTDKIVPVIIFYHNCTLKGTTMTLTVVILICALALNGTNPLIMPFEEGTVILNVPHCLIWFGKAWMLHWEVDLHLSKSIFSLDPDNLPLCCFLGLGALLCCSFFCPLKQLSKTLQTAQVTPHWAVSLVLWQVFWMSHNFFLSCVAAAMMGWMCAMIGLVNNHDSR